MGQQMFRKLKLKEMQFLFTISQLALPLSQSKDLLHLPVMDLVSAMGRWHRRPHLSILLHLDFSLGISQLHLYSPNTQFHHPQFPGLSLLESSHIGTSRGSGYSGVQIRLDLDATAP